ncbi:amidohydrolase [Thalassospira sp. MCCC 1A01428]|uniref:amidohydrolase family protein n=1 Tax=Thalassospira sp. MCCC 1A01428 TaxID=1470575 RepID=UPI000A1D8579|nr:amidohydrolase family protein [Thalassospira sp. MCCC 1A01428]OSQ43054.1 amidohydrolase [Thalassospira sp. MCCC 1A01428]
MANNIALIDAHQHFWQIDRGDYGWLTPDVTALYRDFLPDDLEPILTGQNIAKTVLVQAAPSVAETDFMLSLASMHDFIAGVVGWVDFEEPNAAIADIARWAKHDKFVAVRPMIQDIEDPAWMLRAEFAPVFEALMARNLAFDALVHPRHLGNLQILARRYASLRIVIDHAAKPKIRNGIHGPDAYVEWARMMGEFTPLKNVYCKVSGLLTEAGEGAGLHDLKPYLDHLPRVFGADRLMWGSDWPVLGLAADYADWVKMTREWLGSFAPSEAEKIAAKTAAHFYQLQ